MLIARPPLYSKGKDKIRTVRRVVIGIQQRGSQTCSLDCLLYIELLGDGRKILRCKLTIILSTQEYFHPLFSCIKYGVAFVTHLLSYSGVVYADRMTRGESSYRPIGGSRELSPAGLEIRNLNCQQSIIRAGLTGCNKCSSIDGHVLQVI